MNILRAERDALDAYLPGLDKYLSETPLLELERPGNGALRKFKELGGPGLLPLAPAAVAAPAQRRQYIMIIIMKR